MRRAAPHKPTRAQPAAPPTVAPDRCHDTTSWAERCCPRGRGSRAGKQTRSFCYIDDAVEGILRLMVSDYKKPLNIGSDEMVSMNQMAELVMKIGSKPLPIKCAAIPKPPPPPSNPTAHMPPPPPNCPDRPPTVRGAPRAGTSRVPRACAAATRTTR